MKKTLSLILIILGILLLLTPTITDHIVGYYSQSVLGEDLSNQTLIENNQALDRNQDGQDDAELTAVEDVSIMSVIKASREFNKDLAIGIIHIPDLAIELPIMKGVNDANLMTGAATMKSDQSLGEGNYPLAGHIMKNKDLLFGSLMDIELETRVYLSDGQDIYEYEIYDTQVVPDTALYMLDDARSDEIGGPIVSLMTCYHSSKTGKRFFALGRLIDDYPVE